MRPVKPSTRLVRPGGPGASPPLDRSTTFAYREPRGAYYQRHGHPTGDEAEQLLGELDGGHALLFPSGAGATTALLTAFWIFPLLLGSGAEAAVVASVGTGDVRAYAAVAKPPSLEFLKTWLGPSPPLTECQRKGIQAASSPASCHGRTTPGGRR